MKITCHVIKNDTGLAPNPFHGYCTSALCTPSHMNAQLRRGDWLVGNSTVADNHRLVYAMRISEVLSMQDYFHDPRFQAKKPDPTGTADTQCGDNFYYQEDDKWRRLPSRFHNAKTNFIQDLGKHLSGRSVFVSDHFYYFGENRVAIPECFSAIIKQRQGLKNNATPLAESFVAWLESSYSSGRLGLPADFADRSIEDGPMITALDNSHDVQIHNSTPASQVPPSKPRGCR